MSVLNNPYRVDMPLNKLNKTRHLTFIPHKSRAIKLEIGLVCSLIFVNTVNIYISQDKCFSSCFWGNLSLLWHPYSLIKIFSPTYFDFYQSWHKRTIQVLIQRIHQRLFYDLSEPPPRKGVLRGDKIIDSLRVTSLENKSQVKELYNIIRW